VSSADDVGVEDVGRDPEVRGLAVVGPVFLVVVVAVADAAAAAATVSMNTV
jgi:hypothetical protein